ncbi:uncharacterized protein LOC128683288 isoform X2 [Plodia interpunctella]|nr:uncharacterized protein LOC128683288 isoform X2 [Plodia interpunctella]
MLRDVPAQDLSTCPLTTKNSSSIVSTTPSPSPNLTTIVLNDSTTAPIPPHIESSSPASKLPILPTKQITRSHGPFTTISPTSVDVNIYPRDYPSYENIKKRRQFGKYRRRIMPMEYYYYYDIPVRPEYFRVPRTFRPHRNINYNNEQNRRMMNIDNGVNLTKRSSSPRPSVSFTKANRTSASKQKSTKPSSRLISTQKKVAKNTTTFTSEVITENVVMPQIARELFNELKGGGLTMEHPKTTKRNLRTRITKTGKSMKFSDFVKRYADELKHRTTIKIYLDHSTRLPFPLPENNAYCFMNPKSALCRSNI